MATSRSRASSTAEPYLPERRTLGNMREAVQECRGCGLYEHATQAVFGEGLAKSEVMMVGEQPGDSEDREGRPFVGPAGRLLDRALVDAGIDGFAHLVRDKEMDDGLIASIVRHNVYVMPNLSPEWNTYTELPHWLKDGDPLMTLLRDSVPAPVIDRMRKGYENRNAAAVERTGLGLLVVSFVVHAVGPSIVSALGGGGWAYQLKGVLKHSAELGGWLLVATGVAAACRQASPWAG